MTAAFADAFAVAVAVADLICSVLYTTVTVTDWLDYS
jgi:hypothetical protein